MAIALVANTGAGSAAGGNITTPDINTSGANLIVAAMGNYSAGSAGSVSENKGNGAPTGLTTYLIGGGERLRIFYWLNPSVGSGHNFSTTSGAASYPSLCVAAFSGVKITSPWDKENGAFASASTVQPGSITPSEDNELVVSAVEYDASRTMSINSSFSITDQINYGAGAHFGTALAYLIQTSLAAVNPTWTAGSTTSLTAAIACFKSAAATTKNGWPYWSLFGSVL
jgi:hypothetical protein